MPTKTSVVRPAGERPARAPDRPRAVVALVLDAVVPFDLAIPCQVFGWGRPDLGAVRYQLTLCAATPGPIRTAAGFDMEVTHGLEALGAADLVIVPGVNSLRAGIPTEVTAALRAAHVRGACIASICTGAFVLAAAGLLDGRRATTHWMDAEYLASLYPAIRVEPDVLYVDEGSILTSAGIAAGIDLCLHLVRRDYGPDVANAVARRLVAAPHRAGGQAQFIEHAQRPTPTPGIARACAWALAHLAEPLTVDSLAAAASMSRRTFTRTFRADTGGSPHQWLLRQRILLARRLLEQTADPVERVAASCGFGSALSLRQHFNRLVGCGPLAYRRSFRGAAGGGPS